MKRFLAAPLVLLSCALLLGACGGEGNNSPSEESSPVAQQTPEGDDGGQGGSVDIPADSWLDAVASSFMGTQGEKFDRYEVDGTTLRLFVADGQQLAGSECIILDGAVGDDHPEATVILVDGDTETTC